MIDPKCDRCDEELKEMGGILLSPPNKKGMVKKYHLCKSCYKDVLTLIQVGLARFS